MRFRGRWVHVTAEEIRAALDVWKRKGGPLTAREVIGLALGAPSDQGPLPLDGVQASGWLDEPPEAAEGRRRRWSRWRRPDGLRGHAAAVPGARATPGSHFLGRWGFGACLADDMGLGKTVQALALVQQPARERPRRPDPAGLPDVGGRQLAEGGRALHARPAACWSTTAAGARAGRRLRPQVARARPRPLQLRAAAPRPRARSARSSGRASSSTRRRTSRTPRRGRPRPRARCRRDCRIALTGTPVENHVGDLWASSSSSTRACSAAQAEFKRDVLRAHPGAPATPTAAARLKRLTGPFILRRLKTDQRHHPRPAREDGDEGLLHPHARAGDALRGGRRRRLTEDIEAADGGDRAQGPRAGGADAAEAGLQPPRAVPGRPLRARPAARASSRA